ncbi:unnamed protein product [Bemisia tabaci]|uniref:Uncharacterized protein n=1 Tax=Bemisia tabaci TaxID=7038 RepID=A0A9P0CEA4_BEMTA|nr:unnamed protein product [Bemisia tabaci]
MRHMTPETPRKKEKSDKKTKEPKKKTNHDEAARKKILEQRLATDKLKQDRWIEILKDVLARSDTSDVHKLMLEKCLEPQFVRYVPRKTKKSFVNLIILSGGFEAKHSKTAEELFAILKTAEGSVPNSVKRREARLKKMQKKKLRKAMKAGQEGGAPAKVKVEKAEKMEEDGNDDEEMAEVKTEVKSEPESDNEAGGTSGPTLKVKGRSKKNRVKLEKVGSKVLHLQGKLNKNKKGKGKDNNKRRSK